MTLKKPTPEIRSATDLFLNKSTQDTQSVMGLFMNNRLPDIVNRGPLLEQGSNTTHTLSHWPVPEQGTNARHSQP